MSATSSPCQAKVLLVDDEPANRLALRAVLEGLDLTLVEVQSGEEALHHLLESPFAVVLLDVQMPGLDGFETAKLIRGREETRHTPIIFQTAFEAERATVEKAYTLGAVDFLVKPLLPVILQAKVMGFVDLFRQRRQIEERTAELRASEERFRLLVEGARDYAIFMLDPTGRVVSWNPGAERFKQYKADEIIGQHFSKFYSQEALDRDWPAYELKVAAAEGRFEDEGWRIRKDGSQFWANVVITALKDERGNLLGFSKITRDLTTRKHAEENARRLAEETAARQASYEERQRLQVTLESIGDAVISTDAQGRVTFLNPVAEELVGWRSVEAAGRNLEDVFRIVNEETRQPVENPALRALKEGKIVGLANHTVLISKYGTERPIDDSAAPIRSERGDIFGSVLVFRDISEHKRIEKEQQEAHRRIVTTLESISDGFMRFDRDWRVVYVNAEAERINQRPREEMLGKSHWELFPATVGTRLEAEYRKCVSEQVAVEFENYYEPWGRWIAIKGYPSPDGGLAIYFRDVTEHKQAEDAVRRAEEQLRNITDTIPALISYVDADGRYRLNNRTYELWFGHPRSQITGRYMRDVMGDEAWSVVRPKVEAALAGQTVHYESQVVYKDAGLRWIDATYVPSHGAGGEVVGVVVLVNDITERKRAEETLAVSEERLRLALDAGHMGVWDWNIRTGGLKWSDSLEPLHGLTPGTFGGTFEHFQQLIYPDDRDMVNAAIRQALETGGEFYVEFRNVWQNGGIHWIAGSGKVFPGDDGQPLRMIGIGLDVTQRKRAEQTARFLADASAALAVLVDFDSTLQKVASLAVPHFADWATVDVAEGDGTLRRVAVAHVDPAKVELAHEVHRRFPPNPAAPHGVWNILRTSRPEIVPEITDEMLVQSVKDDELLRIMRDLGLKSYIGVPLNVRGKTLGVITFINAESGHCYDSTDLAVAEDLASRASIAIENAQLYRALRDADQRKDEFLATLAHELRNPLAPIRNGLQVIRLAGGDGGMVEKTCSMMERQLSQMVRLVDDLLDVSRITRNKIDLKKQRVELAAVVQSAIETSRPLIEQSGHEFTVTLPPAPIYLDADLTRLTQVFSNLLNNAARYTEAGGHIRLVVERQGSDVLVSVQDDGVGIAAEMLPRLFEMFAQATPALERSQGGLGIGLSLVKGVVELHGGRVEARSEGPGRGAEFTVRLPVMIETRVQEAPQEDDDEPPCVAKCRILVVDDLKDIADSLTMLLRLTGHEVHTAYDGEEAVIAAEKLRPEVVLLDIGMPKLNGYDACRHIREKAWGKGIYLIALTGWGQDDDRRRTEAAGFNAHMVKPVNPRDLMKVLAGLHAAAE